MNSIKNNRAFSFIAVTLIYILATVIGIYTFQAVNYSWWLSLLIADIVATIVVFAFSLLFGNASVYDPYWSVQPPIILLAFMFSEKPTIFGIILLFVVLFWGIRLTANWAYTFANLNHQDWRYTMLKEKTGNFYPFINFLGIHLVPTLIVYACVVPAVFAMRNELTMNNGSFLCLCLSVFATSMQGIADLQMHKFRNHRTSTFIRSGLWKYSRHPNYLGEILMWWGVGLSVFFAAPHMPVLLIGALSNTVLFLTVSIPMADNRQSAKEGFDEYKHQTRMLLPVKK